MSPRGRQLLLRIKQPTVTTMLLGLRVAALLLLCTPGSATVEELSTGLKEKLEQMGADSMAKRVRTPRPHMPPTPTTCTPPPPFSTTHAAASDHRTTSCPGLLQRHHAKAHHHAPPPLQAGVGGVAGFVGGYLVKYSQARKYVHCARAACTPHVLRTHFAYARTYGASPPSV